MVSAVLPLALAPTSAQATCDLCSIYVAQQQQSFGDGAFNIGVAEQFTSFGELQINGDRVDNSVNQYLKSSTTQILTRYDFNRDLALQGNIPLISRSYRRLSEDGEGEKGSLSGLGDVSLNVLYSPLHFENEESFFRLVLQAGLKMPTGDSDKLAEEDHSHHHEDDLMNHPKEEHHHEVESESHVHSLRMRSLNFRHSSSSDIPDVVHSHSLALGSGSWDGVFGTNFFGRCGKAILSGNLQYIYRTEGSFDYEFADDFLWEFGAGSYVYIDDVSSVTLRANLSGEVKGMDSASGVRQNDSGITSLFAGPELNVAFGRSLFAITALDLPVFVDNTGSALVADYRLRFAAVVRF
jgi:hypothetical protein